jgi:transposase-like protein
MQGPRALLREATDSSRCETRHIERDAGVTSNSVDFSASSISAVANRDLEELLAERGLDLSYETIRRWVLNFGPANRHSVRRACG